MTVTPIDIGTFAPWLLGISTNRLNTRNTLITHTYTLTYTHLIHTQSYYS